MTKNRPFCQAVVGWREAVTRTTSMAAAAKAEASAFQELVLQDWASVNKTFQTDSIDFW